MAKILTKQETYNIMKKGISNWTVEELGAIMYSLRYYIEKTDELDIALDDMCEECNGKNM